MLAIMSPTVPPTLCAATRARRTSGLTVIVPAYADLPELHNHRGTAFTASLICCGTR